MSTVIVQLPAETERKLRRQADLLGQTLATFIERLAETAAGAEPASTPASAADEPRYISDPKPTKAEFEQILGDLAAGPALPVLPPDFSRADIYNDHD